MSEWFTAFGVALLCSLAIVAHFGGAMLLAHFGFRAKDKHHLAAAALWFLTALLWFTAGMATIAVVS